MNGQTPPSRLNGWKEIAAHFGKGVRTVQRWEAEFRMPVHRMGGSRSEAVYAFDDELEQWRLTAEAKRAERQYGHEHSDGAGNGTVEPKADSGALPGQAHSAAGGTSATPAAHPSWRVRILAGAAVIVVAAASWILWSSAPGDDDRNGPAVSGRSASPRATGPAPGSAAAQPASGRVEGGVLKVFDADGRFLWDKRFAPRLTDASYLGVDGVKPRPGSAFAEDIDDDGNAEVLFVHEPGGLTSRGLFCFNGDGSERFTHQPQATVRFGSDTYAPPWRGLFVRSIGGPGRPHHIWFVSLHLLEYPTIVEKLDPQGEVLGRYWSNGQVTAIEEGVIDDRRVVLVGATSNEFKGATLAVLDAARPDGAAPADRPKYRCHGCPAAVPLAFLVFPRLEVSAAADSYSSVSDIRVDELGQVMVAVYHDPDPILPTAETVNLSNSYYVLDRDFRVVKAELGDKYGVVHRMMENTGLLTHPFVREREERDLWPVLRWNGRRFVRITGPEPPM